MKIVAVGAREERFPLTRPYTIAYKSIAEVTNVVVTIQTDAGLVGLGAASPAPFVTGESAEACAAALSPARLEPLIDRDPRHLPALLRELPALLPGAPAARAAIDMALHDLLAQQLQVPLVEMLGRAHEALPTSITIGIKPLDETLAEADEYLGRGFRHLKVKLGRDLEHDIERLRALRDSVGDRARLRVDANQGYSVESLRRFLAATERLDLELIEQPVAAAATAALRELSESQRARLAADESLKDDRDAWRLAQPPAPCGIFNIKLMKCGGVGGALRIATIAAHAGISLMWGCMDESRVSIAAALHVALACPGTRYLDLDGSLDLARDVADGGFVLEEGTMRTTERPGLGLWQAR
jgi:L-alanine-DL-glutamate epimerase-like enolase superfamily enzyme